MVAHLNAPIALELLEGMASGRDPDEIVNLFGHRRRVSRPRPPRAG